MPNATKAVQDNYNSRMVPFQCRLRAETVESLKQAREETGMSESAIVRKLLESWARLRKKRGRHAEDRF